MDCVCFTVIVDDIVLPHGETVMEVLGGGGEHSMHGPLQHSKFPAMVLQLTCSPDANSTSGPQTLFGYQLVTNKSAAVGLSGGSWVVTAKNREPEHHTTSLPSTMDAKHVLTCSSCASNPRQCPQTDCAFLPPSSPNACLQPFQPS